MKIVLENNEQVALIGFNNDIDFLEEEMEFCNKNNKLATYSSWLIQEEFIDLYQQKKPFNLYINTGNKNLEYVYKIEDFVTKRGADGIKCPSAWMPFVSKNSYYYQTLEQNDFIKYPLQLSLPIKTWLLISDIKKVKTKVEWSKMRDIRGIPARSSGKSYYLYVVDPISGKE